MNPAFLLSQLTAAELRNQCSESVFERGMTYASGGAVRLLADQPKLEVTDHRFRIDAQVTGTETYLVCLQFVRGKLDGSCNCLGGQDGWFCKHMVASALVWTAAQSGLPVEVDAQSQKKVHATIKRAQTILDNQIALEKFLTDLPAADLAQKLIALAKQDKTLTKELQAWRKVHAVVSTGKDIKPAITTLLSSKKPVLHWHESAPYVKKARAVFDLIAQQTAKTPLEGLDAARHAFERASAVLNKSDDSGGQIGRLCYELGELVLKTAALAGPLAATCVPSLFKTLLADHHGNLPFDQFLQCFSSEGREQLKALCLTRYRITKDFEQSHTREWLIAIYTDESDFESAIALLKQDCAGAYRYIKLVEYLVQIGREREAFSTAESALKKHPDDRHLQNLVLPMYRRDGWYAEAFELSKAKFYSLLKSNSFHAIAIQQHSYGNEHLLNNPMSYTQLISQQLVEFLADTKAAGRDVTNERQAIDLHFRQAEETTLKQAQLHFDRTHSSANFAVKHAVQPKRDVTTRLELLLAEIDWPSVFKLVEDDVQYSSAMASSIATLAPIEYNKQCLQICKDRVDNEMQTDTNPYRTSLTFVKIGLRLMTAFDGQQWLNQLRERYKIKTRFVSEIAGLQRTVDR